MMKLLKKNAKPLMIGCVTFIISVLVLLCIFRFAKGYDWWMDNIDIVYFMPVWSAIFGIAGFVYTKKYINLKDALLPEGERFDNEEIARRTKEWKKQLNWKKAKYLLYIARGCALIFPGYLLAYFDNSEYLVSNIPTLIIIAVIGIASYVAHRWLKARCESM